MRVLIIGAYGFIGSHIAAALHARGHEIVAAGRNIAFGRRRYSQFEWEKCDLNTYLSPDDWRPLLNGVDAVVNAAGVLQTTRRDSSEAIHHKGPAALFEACEEQGVARVIQISALGAGSGTGTDFASTKASGDTALQAHKLDWVILRPSLVYATGTFGGTTMLRALAGAPFLTPCLAGEQLMQPVHMDDLTAIVARFLEPDAPSRKLLNVVGPEEMSIATFVQRTRAWLGFPPQPELVIPRWLAALGAKFGDLAGQFGSKTSFRSTALQQMQEPNVAPMAPLVGATGITPRSVTNAYVDHPAQTQDRWHARLLFLKPLARIVLALFWIFTGLVLLDPVSFSYAAGVLIQVGFADTLAGPLAIAGGIVDAMLGLALLFRWHVRKVIGAMIAVSLFYLAVLTISLPGLWFDALGVLTKVVPIMVLMLIVAAIEDER